MFTKRYCAIPKSCNDLLLEASGLGSRTLTKKDLTDLFFEQNWKVRADGTVKPVYLKLDDSIYLTAYDILTKKYSAFLIEQRSLSSYQSVQSFRSLSNLIEATFENRDNPEAKPRIWESVDLWNDGAEDDKKKTERRSEGSGKRSGDEASHFYSDSYISELAGIGDGPWKRTERSEYQSFLKRQKKQKRRR